MWADSDHESWRLQERDRTLEIPGEGDKDTVNNGGRAASIVSCAMNTLAEFRKTRLVYCSTTVPSYNL